jgi:hypothetical protein
MINLFYDKKDLSINAQKWMKHYQKLCTRGQERASTRKEAKLIFGYVEDHHIYPKCMGGSNDRSNKVFLTASEHFVAHQLLAKIFPNNYSLILACRYMCIHSTNKRMNNKEFSWIKKKNSELQSIKMTGPGNPMYCKPGPMLGRIFTKEHRYNMSMSQRGKMCSEETKIKISVSAKNRDPEERLGLITDAGSLILSDNMKQQRKNEEFNEALRKSLKGLKPWNTGLNHTLETRQKISDTKQNYDEERQKEIHDIYVEAAKNRSRICCIECKKEFPNNIFNRHNIACLKKKNSNKKIELQINMI